ncbi:hypothetical protein [Streptomyces sp. NPDC093591]|uniref:hypothetical protein n=1 Tax=Streptomyces sp. NPDC093591 TaxID=3366044 RepID=UPI003803E857
MHAIGSHHQCLTESSGSLRLGRWHAQEQFDLSQHALVLKVSQSFQIRTADSKRLLLVVMQLGNSQQLPHLEHCPIAGIDEPSTRINLGLPESIRPLAREL